MQTAFKKRDTLNTIHDFLIELETHPAFQNRIRHVETLPPAPPKLAGLEILSDALKKGLASSGIHHLYDHQAQAIRLLQNGKNVFITTPTASGKTLAYTLTVFENILKNPEEKALYIFPMKALAQDQKDVVNEFAHAFKINADCAVYDGDTPLQERAKIKKNFPSVILTNPDMLHVSLLPYHASWRDFYKNLSTIVFDEAHLYRGIFGSHVSGIIRRLRRICDYYGSAPQFICCSATMANPKEFIETLTGLPFETVSQNDASPHGKKFLLWEPEGSAYTDAAQLFASSVKRGLKTICFTKSRRITELIYKWSVESHPEIARKIRAYRAGYLPSERRAIEADLFSERLHGVVSTSALEVGIDVGGLDVCLLVGYPGSIMSTYQRAGRVGRKGDGMVVLLGLEDALDRYFLENPKDFFSRPYEAAIVDTGNEFVLKKQLACACAELPVAIRGDEKYVWHASAEKCLNELAEDNILSKGAHGLYYSRERFPQKDVSIRSIGEMFHIIEAESGESVGTVEYPKVFRECHDGAVYLHSGLTYVVSELNVNMKAALVAPKSVNYYTEAKSAEDIQIIQVEEQKTLSAPKGKINLYYGTIRVTEQVTGYVRKSTRDQSKLSEHPLALPPHEYETKSLWFSFPENFSRDLIKESSVDVPGSLHGAEHAMIALFPLFALCDRMDLGGLSTEFFHEYNAPAIFLHEAYPGGVGLTKRAYQVADALVSATLKLVSECSCEYGCPSCIQSPKCGNQNKPLDKEGTVRVLNILHDALKGQRT